MRVLMVSLAGGALAAVFALPAAAQTCAPGSRLVKNDILPDNPSSFQTIGVVPGVCENEAVMSVLDLTISAASLPIVIN